MINNITDLYQYGQNSIASQRINRSMGALKILSGSGRLNMRDSLHISDTARMYSKEHIIALIHSCHTLSVDDFSFYFDNYNNISGLLDAINFSEDFLEDSYCSELKEFGVLSFEHNGKRQYIPNYAVPKMKASAFPPISAKDNKLILQNKGYYCYSAKNGKSYTWTANNGNVGWAHSESMLDLGENKSGYNYRWEMRKAEDLVTRLAKGKSTYGYSNQEQKEILAGFGITEGHFTIDAGAGERHYLLQNNGVIVDVEKRIELMNKTNWIKQGYQTGEVINVYGKECVIDDEGHIQVSVDDAFSDMEIFYPEKVINKYNM